MLRSFSTAGHKNRNMIEGVRTSGIKYEKNDEVRVRNEVF